MCKNLEMLPLEGIRVVEVAQNLAGPYGAHGIGEPCVTNYPAIANAIYNATGKWVDPRGGPITPDIVLAALGKATIPASLLSR